MSIRSIITALVIFLSLAAISPASAEDTKGSWRDSVHNGSAVVRQVGGDSEALIRILCDEASRPEAGFTTEANRVTRAETGGQYNRASLRLRPWKDTGDVLITTNWGVAWIPQPTSVGGVLSLTVDVRPATFVRNYMPVAVTYDMWKAGDVPSETATVKFEADCNVRDPAAPAWRKLNDDEQS